MLRLLSRRLDYYARKLRVNLSTESNTPKITESTLKEKLSAAFPMASDIQIEDISGGCGAMFQIYVEAPDFKGLNTVKQHKLINEALKEEIKSMHGIRISTGVSK